MKLCQSTSLINKRPKAQSWAVSEQLRTLKVACAAEVRAPFSEILFRSIGACLSEFFMVLRPKHENRVCDNYGHVVVFKNTSAGSRPVCRDCGKKITDPSQLRRSVPIAETGKKKMDCHQ